MPVVTVLSERSYILSNKKYLLAVGALSLLLSGCQGSLAYELMQAAKGSGDPSGEQVQNMMPIVEDMEKLPSAAELSKRKIRPRKWGAYAAFPEAKMLWATDKPYDSPEAASADALKECRKASGQNCQTYTIYSNLCFAVAQGKRNGKPFTAFGYGPTESLAKSVGVANCRDQGAQNCEPVPGAPASCATPCNLISDKSCRYEQPAYIFPGKNGNKMKTMPSFFGRMGG